MHSKFFLLILLSTIYLRHLSGALNCSDDAFNCGNITYIAYPFWGGPRGSECGRKGFEIVCNSDDTPTIKISSLSYALHNLNFATNTLTVARVDLQDTYCPQTLHNTTLDWDLFHYPPKSTDRNLTLSYNCASSSPLLNAFTCANHTSSNLFNVDDSSSSFSDVITCDASIYVPINNKDAESLRNPTDSINILRSALNTGFSIQWFNDSLQTTLPYCNPKVYRSCRVAEATIGVSALCAKGHKCYLSSGTSLSTSTQIVTLPAQLDGDSPAPSPGSSAKGIAPPPTTAYSVPSPGSSAKGIAPAPTTAYSGYGLPPAPSTGYHPRPHTNPQIHNGAKGGKRIIIIGVALGVAGILAISISVLCFLKTRHSVTAPNPDRKHDVETFLLQQGSLAPKRYRYSEIKKITKSFSDKLGQGGFGSVYKGMLADGCPVAVKILIQTDSNGEEFINEVASISRTSHVNIVTLLGFCNEGNKRALVYEFMPNTSLDKFLNNNPSECQLDLEKLYKIAIGTAKGLEYLHTGCNTRIVHFDIKPQNILLDEDLRPKISDFGLAKLYRKKQSILSVLGMRGTAGYIAPEVFSRNFGGVSYKSDVYSYGMMLLDMVGAKKVDEADAIQSSEHYFPDKIYDEVTKNVDELMMEEGRRKMMLVGFWCIQTIPSSRPSISKVVEMLEGSVEAIEIPPKPFLFSLGHDTSGSVEVENSGEDEMLTSELASTFHFASNPNNV